MLAGSSFGPSWERAWGVGVLVVVIVTSCVFGVSLLRTPVYETQAKVRTSGAIEKDAVVQEAIESLPDAHLNAPWQVQLTRAKVLENLTVERSEDTGTYLLIYEDSDPFRAQLIVNTVGRISGELVRPARLPETPVAPNPLRDTLLTLVIGLAVLVLWIIVRSRRTT